MLFKYRARSIGLEFRVGWVYSEPRILVYRLEPLILQVNFKLVLGLILFIDQQLKLLPLLL